MCCAARIESFIAERFLFDPQATIDHDQSLLANGILDSTGVVELVMFIEDEFAIRVADEEMLAQNLDTIASIARFIETKMTHSKAA